MEFTAENLKHLVNQKLLHRFGCRENEATIQQIYRAVCIVVRDILSEKRNVFENEIDSAHVKQVYYMSMEFLVGTSLQNNLYKLGIEQEMIAALKDFKVDINMLYKMDPDAGLGNGGLGRLASCYMDSASTLNIPFTGFSLRYEFGIFKQKIVDGWQMEFPDNWLDLGDSWLSARPDDAVEVKFDGHITETWTETGLKVEHHGYNSVIAVPHDMLIAGYDSKGVNPLVLWSAKSPNRMDFDEFSRGEFLRSMEQNTIAESITKVLYPADDHWTGKELRLKQQYLLVCASLQSIIKEFIKNYKDIRLLPEKVAIHINDTHPSLCVPELMRILLDEFHISWDEAWDITGKTLAYTNHTVMSEALEKWPIALFSQKLPRIFQIVTEIDHRFNIVLYDNYKGDAAKINYMAILADGNVKMANLCIACCHTVNGVSKLHSDILANDIFRDFAYIMPNKFTNVTNGVAYRRWLCQSNPKLTALLTECIGDGFIKDASELEKFMDFKDDKKVLRRLQKIKADNKLVLADYISQTNGINVDPTSIFDIQVKRLHEYKRQLLNALHIIHLYLKIKENPSIEMQPRTFIFAAKASAGYFMAKQIIRLISCLGELVNHDVQVRDKIKVVFVEDYRVSLAQIIIPACEISEQISIAGKEASGTGNMKFMMNGAVTVGTMDGANVEIFEQVGQDNILIFGMSANEVNELWQRGYHPNDIANHNPNVKAVIDFLRRGIHGVDFNDIANALTTGSFGHADSYMALADFDSYVNIHNVILERYQDKNRFNQMSLINIAKSGIFSSDRSVLEYADKIWNTKRISL